MEAVDLPRAISSIPDSSRSRLLRAMPVSWAASASSSAARTPWSPYRSRSCRPLVLPERGASPATKTGRVSPDNPSPSPRCRRAPARRTGPRRRSPPRHRVVPTSASNPANGVTAATTGPRAALACSTSAWGSVAFEEIRLRSTRTSQLTAEIRTPGVRDDVRKLAHLAHRVRRPGDQEAPSAVSSIRTTIRGRGLVPFRVWRASSTTPCEGRRATGRSPGRIRSSPAALVQRLGQ